MKKSKVFIYLLLVFAVIMISVTTTLALIQDSETKVGNIMNFGKVSIYADNAGVGEKVTVLSTAIESNLEGGVIKNGDKIITRENAFKVATTADSADCFLRVRFYFTTDNADLNEANETLLESMSNTVPQGLNLYSTEDYKFVIEQGWAYLCVNDGTDNLLKVATKNDNSYIITEDYTIDFDDIMLMNVTDFSLKVQNAGAELMLVTEVYAVQAHNLKTIESVQNAAGTNDTILSAGLLEEFYGNVTIRQFIQALIQNAEKSGLPTVAKASLNDWTWEEINVASELIELANSKKKVTGNNYSVKHKNIRITSIEVGTRSNKSSNYDWTFTFEEFGVINTISLYDITNRSKDKFSFKTAVVPGYSNFTVVVVDFLHDKRANGTAVGITFNTSDLLPGYKSEQRKYCYECEVGYFGSHYKSCSNYIRTYLSGTFYNKLNPATGNVVEKVQKCAYNGITERHNYGTDGAWALAGVEIGSTAYYSSSSEGTYYPVYNQSFRNKSARWWTRSMEDNFGKYIAVWSGDNVRWNEYSGYYGVVVGFCI